MLIFLPACVAAAQISTHLSNDTVKAFDSYVQILESKKPWQASLQVKRGEIEVSAWNKKTPTSVDGGLIHDWIGGVEVPNATIEQALALFQNYDNYKTVFAPEVVDSRLLSRQGNVWKPWLRLRRENVVTTIFDTEYQVEYKRLEAGAWAIVSRSTRISEVQNGEELPPGTGTGYLWRLNAYWLLLPRSGGIYFQCRSVSLSRDIPAMLRWMVQPMISGIPRESLHNTLDAARRGLE